MNKLFTSTVLFVTLFGIGLVSGHGGSYDGHPEGMMGGIYGFGFGWFMMILVIIVLVLFIVWLIKQLTIQDKRKGRKKK